MSAFEELSGNGELGRETVALFVFHVSTIAWRRGYPSPSGGRRWSRDDCLSWVIEFFEKKGPQVAMALYYKATDEGSFTALARTAIENELKDQAKATTVGRLRSRMRTLLPKVDDFVDATALYAKTPAWTLDFLGAEIYHGDWTDLLSAHDLKLIDPIRALNTAGPTSQENTTKLVQAARVLLRTAGGAMRDQDLAGALVRLFDLEEPDVFFGRDDDAGESSAQRPLAPEEHVEAIEFAARIILELARDEGIALLVLDEPISLARELLPSVPDVSTFLGDVRAKLVHLIGEDPPPRGGLDLVVDWCRRLPDP